MAVSISRLARVSRIAPQQSKSEYVFGGEKVLTEEDIFRIRLTVKVAPFRKEHINITLNSDYLVVSALRKDSSTSGDFLSRTGSLFIPGEVDPSRISARYRRGKLILELPKGKRIGKIPATVDIQS